MIRRKDERRKLKGTTCKECEIVGSFYCKANKHLDFPVIYLKKKKKTFSSKVLRSSTRGGKREEVVRMFQTQVSVCSSFYSRKLLGSGFSIHADMHQKRWFYTFPSVALCRKHGQYYRKRWCTNLLLGYIKEEKNPQARSRRRQPFNALFSPKTNQEEV